jgi:starch synthase (maltosyl-transferring)
LPGLLDGVQAFSVIGRIVVDDVRPRTPFGDFPAKATLGRELVVSADIVADGHDVLAAQAILRPVAGPSGTPVQVVPLAEGDNDRFVGRLRPAALGRHELVVEAWRDRHATWRHRIEVLLAAGELDDPAVVRVELEEGARLLEGELEREPGVPSPGALVGGVGVDEMAAIAEAVAALRDEDRPLSARLEPAFAPELVAALRAPGPHDVLSRSGPWPLWVDRLRAEVGAWYEFFPRSEGGFRGAAARLEAIAAMGFDVVYLPPVHPIGRSARKGRGGALTAGPGDPGSPWAIGSAEGGHEALHPELGTLEDFAFFVERAGELGLEVALDYALQCSPDHPWVRTHPEWFRHRADGSIAYAENPPKKYQDIVPLDFWPAREEDRQALWDACVDILLLWRERGVRIFRVDNPHTKPLAFWSYAIDRVHAVDPEVIFLAEAFTRPKMMSKLAEVGFSQSYTYFTWRTTKEELATYALEVTAGRAADWMRPAFWPNTPDILSGPLRRGNVAAFKARLVMAATMVPTYGIYSGYELIENEPAAEDNEEYAWSEKYEIKHRDWSAPWSIAPFVAGINAARRRHPALQQLSGLAVEETTNPALLAYSRRSADGGDRVLVVVNLDPYRPQDGWLTLDLARLGIDPTRGYLARDEVTGATFPWFGNAPYVRLDPAVEPAHVLALEQP